MKRFGIVLFALFSFSSLFGQANKDWDGIKPEVSAGSMSVAFTYTPFQSDLGGVPTSSLISSSGSSVDLVGVGYKIFIANRFSLLIGLGWGISSSTREADSISSVKVETSDIVWGGSVAGNFHLPSFYSITAYFGPNVNIGIYSTETKSTTSAGIQRKDEYSNFSFGLGAHFGFDWFFTEGMSLGGKYSLGFQITPESEETITYSSGTPLPSTEKTPSRFVLGTSIVSILLNVHF